MNRYLGPLLSFILVACGGSPSGDTLPTDSIEDEGSVADSGEQESADGADDGQAGDTDAPDDNGAVRGASGNKGGKHKDAGEFAINKADETTRPEQAKLKPTETEAAIRFFVLDKKKGPVEGIVISLKSPSGKVYYTPETDKDGFTEVLAPVGRTYELVFLSLGRRDIAARVEVADKPRFNLKLTLRYEREELPTGTGLVLENVQFESGKAKLTASSYALLDPVVEYMTHKPKVRIEISGHTDNVGNRRANKRLSQRRASAVREYLVSKGVSGDRIKAVGYGDERPIAPNDTGEGRQKNRRIEAIEL